MILATYAAGARVGADESAVESLWQRKGQFLQSTKGEAIIIGSGVSKTPAGYSLFVGQGLLSRDGEGSGEEHRSEWSDKVFAQVSYNLQPLAEVAAYIGQHQHLPGVPSADEVVKEGMDVAKMNAKLLEKIEELTLYLIELKRENQLHQKESKKQQQQLDRA